MTPLGKLYNHDPRQFRFSRQCEGFHVERESSGWAWWIAGAGVGALILAVVVL